MRIRIVALAFILQGLALAPTWADAGKLGLGVELGQPFGISAKYWVSDQAAIDGGLGGHYGHHAHHYCDDDFYYRHGYYDDGCSDSYVRLDLHSDFLWHFDLPANLPGRLPVYIGAGARLITPYTEVGLRIPLGITYLFDNVPIDLFAEIVPVFVFAPYAAGDLDGGVGIRFYFGGPATTGKRSRHH